MLKDYIINASILIAFISVSYQIFRNSGLNPSVAIKLRILSGGIFGILGVALMFFGIHLPNNLIIDFRNLAVFLSAITGGWVSTTISTLIISVSRLLFHGINKPSIAAIIVLGILLVTFNTITKLNIKNKLRWILCISISQFISCIAYVILIDDIKLLHQILISYVLSSSLASLLLYYYVGYMETIVESFRRYKQEANKDFLTGLNNVRQFDKLYNSIIENRKVTQGLVSLLYIDIDFFKKVNDTYGHKEGDLVLKSLGEILIKTCRSIDIISRNGGEEFAVILIDCPNNLAVEIAEHIRKTIETTPIELSGGLKINITVSIGATSFPHPNKDLNMLREKADMALYEAKRTGRNKVCFHF